MSVTDGKWDGYPAVQVKDGIVMITDGTKTGPIGFIKMTVDEGRDLANRLLILLAYPEE